MCYLNSNDYEEGLRLSIMSQQLGEVSDFVPGSEKTKCFFENNIPPATPLPWREYKRGG
jgi:hypothetical protein